MLVTYHGKLQYTSFGQKGRSLLHSSKNACYFISGWKETNPCCLQANGGLTPLIRAHLDILIKAEGVYTAMFANASTSTTTTNSVNSSNNNMMILNTAMFVLPSEYILGKHITKALLENRTAKRESGLANGRMLHEIGLAAMANMRKALAFLETMSEVTALTPNGVEYKSGITEEEVKIILLQAMYNTLKEEKEVDKDDEEFSDEKTKSDEALENDNGNKERPPTWYFTGWFAFCLFGPFVSEQDRVTIFEPKGTSLDSNKANGRAQMRKDKKNEENTMRMNDCKNKRGTSLEMRINIANLEIRQETIHQQKKERTVFAINCSLTACQKNLDRCEKRAMQLCPEYDADHHAWKKVIQFEAEAERLHQGELMGCASYSPPPKRIKI